MTKLERLEQEIYDAGIVVVDTALLTCRSLTVKDGTYQAIAINSTNSASLDERFAILAHEYGHLETGAVYNDEVPVITRGQCEYRAWKRAVRDHVDKQQLMKALDEFEGNLWLVAEELGVPQELVEQACFFYFDIGIA